MRITEADMGWFTEKLVFYGVLLAVAILVIVVRNIIKNLRTRESEARMPLLEPKSFNFWEDAFNGVGLIKHGLLALYVVMVLVATFFYYWRTP
jgi:hypothetical protein